MTETFSEKKQVYIVLTRCQGKCRSAMCRRLLGCWSLHPVVSFADPYKHDLQLRERVSDLTKYQQN